MTEDMKDDIKKHVTYEVKNRTYIDFDILTGKDQIIKLKEFDYEYDGRLENDNYLNNSFTIIVYVKKTQEVIGKATFFILEYPIWKEVVFWKRNEDVLKKEKLDNFFKDISKKCIIMGYGQISNGVQADNNFSYKGKIIEYYFSILNFLLKESNSVLYCEPCGYYCLPNEILKDDELKISKFNYEKIGQVCPESVVSKKIVEHFHFNKMDLCYHYSTLGPIYYKRV